MIYSGVDIIEIERVEAAIGRWGDRFLRRVFTADERADSADRPRSLAARWAAKEAAAKALGVGLRGIGAERAVGAGAAVALREIEVRRSSGGQPELVLHGAAQARAQARGWRSVALSISHGRDYAVAFVVVEAAHDSGGSA